MSSGIQSVTLHNSFYLYPNPSHNRITLKQTSVFTGKSLQVTISDLVGSVILKETFADIQKELNLDGIISGLYVVTVWDAQGTACYREKLVIE